MEKQFDNIVTDFTLTAPSRLHFGLYSIGGAKRFGGMGLMINHPEVAVRCSASPSFEIAGQQQELVNKVIGLIRNKKYFHQDPTQLPIRIELENSPPRHSGLGSGTQIAFAVTATLIHSLGMPMAAADEMAELVGRGKRSAIGSYGFFVGGCIADSGGSEDSILSPIEARVDFPSEWPIVLICPDDKAGLHGQHEQTAFNSLRDGESQNREYLKQIAHEQIIPGIETRDFDLFANGLHIFNRTSGEYFCDFQAGAYNSPECAAIVREVQDFGCPAIGQSSWGPTLFAVAPSMKLADDLVKHLRNDCPTAGDGNSIKIVVTSANNVGMQICHAID